MCVTILSIAMTILIIVYSYYYYDYFISIFFSMIAHYNGNLPEAVPCFLGLPGFVWVEEQEAQREHEEAVTKIGVPFQLMGLSNAWYPNSWMVYICLKFKILQIWMIYDDYMMIWGYPYDLGNHQNTWFCNSRREAVRLEKVQIN